MYRSKVLVVVAIVLALYGALISLRLTDHDALWFVHLGRAFVASGHTSSVIGPPTKTESEFGYDGQFYYFIAVDPVHGRDYMHVGTVDQSGIRYARIAYPALARASSLGFPEAVPYALIVLNFLAVGIGTWAVAAWLSSHGRSPTLALVYGLWPGIVFSVFRDLAEPVAYALAALGVLAFDVRSRRRLAASAALFAVALLGRETVIAFPVVAAVALALEDRRWRRPTFFLVAALAPMVAWRVFLTTWLRVSTLEPAGGWKVLAPFHGMQAWWPWDRVHWLIFLAVDVPLVCVAAVAVYWIYRRRHVIPALLIVLNVALFVVFIPRTVTIDYGAAGRNATPAVLASVYIFPLLRRLGALTAAAALSVGWFLAVAAALGLDGLKLVTT